MSFQSVQKPVLPFYSVSQCIAKEQVGKSKFSRGYGQTLSQGLRMEELFLSTFLSSSWEACKNRVPERYLTWMVIMITYERRKGLKNTEVRASHSKTSFQIEKDRRSLLHSNEENLANTEHERASPTTMPVPRADIANPSQPSFPLNTNMAIRSLSTLAGTTSRSNLQLRDENYLTESLFDKEGRCSWETGGATEAVVL